MTPADEGKAAVELDAKMFKFLTHMFTTTVTQEDVKHIRYTSALKKRVTFFDVGGMLGHVESTISFKKAEQMVGEPWAKISEWLLTSGARSV